MSKEPIIRRKITQEDIIKAQKFAAEWLRLHSLHRRRIKAKYQKWAKQAAASAAKNRRRRRKSH